MPAPTIFIIDESGMKVLNPRFKDYIREIAQATEASKFLKFYFGGYPNPLDPDRPWGPIGPVVRVDPEPETNFPNYLIGELLLDSIARADVQNHELSVFAAIKKEKMVPDALRDLQRDLKNTLESVSKRIDKF